MHKTDSTMTSYHESSTFDISRDIRRVSAAKFARHSSIIAYIFVVSSRASQDEALCVTSGSAPDAIVSKVQSNLREK
jgi:hypothetical protein